MKQPKLPERLFALLVIPLALLCCPAVMDAQDDAYYKEKFIHNEDAIYKDNIHTVLLYKKGFELSPPIIQLNTDEQLFLCFDDFDTDVKQYRFTFIHCDAYWRTSGIMTMEYLEGFMEDYINDFKFSVNTTRSYTNYQVVFPTDYMKIKKSGNYILKVYNETDDDENVIFTRRFMVTDPKVDVLARVVKTTELTERYTKQQVDFKIVTTNYPITEPYRDLRVVILQNFRWDNAIMNIQPRMILGHELDYSQNPDIVFEAGNEFRYFDMKTLKYNTDRMLGIQYDRQGYQVYLLPDVVRAGKNYRSEEDINGLRLIAMNEGYDPYIEGDYAWVHFYITYPYPVAEGNIYVAGVLTNWQFNGKSKMIYNPGQGAYEASILLKQGYYNYAYAFLPNHSQTASLGYVEGSFWETQNEYVILVYHRRQGDFYDQLVGIQYLESFP